jgi:hypothetical protein
MEMIFCCHREKKKKGVKKINLLGILVPLHKDEVFQWMQGYFYVQPE